jgi:hypothetical protein
MPKDPTRRDVLIQIAAGAAASGTLAQAQLHAQENYEPQNLNAAQYKLLTTLVDMIIPPSDTPGAAGAGVDRLIDETLGRSQERRKALLAGLQMLEEAGFSGLDEPARVKLLTEYSEASDERGEFFRVLKDMTVEGYYSTEIGLVRELGYQGNTYLREFPGCPHEEHP